MNWTAVIWLVLLVIFLAAEASTVTLISLWFAAGSLAAMVVSLLSGPIWLQVFTFLAVSVVLLASVRPMFRKHIKPKIVPTNIDSVIGSQGYVTVPINNLAASGQVKLGSMYWTARSTSGDPIDTGTKVQADRIEGVKVFVSPVKVPEEV